MPSSRGSASTALAILAAFAVNLIDNNPTFASQGPGGGMGTASHFTQTAMAVLVYGTMAVVVCAGLLGAALGRRPR